VLPRAPQTYVALRLLSKNGCQLQHSLSKRVPYPQLIRRASWAVVRRLGVRKLISSLGSRDGSQLYLSIGELNRYSQVARKSLQLILSPPIENRVEQD
jgi:hypothetical protein